MEEVNKFKALRGTTKLSQSQFAELFEIPLATYKKWEQGLRTPPEYVYKMMVSVVKEIHDMNTAYHEYQKAHPTPSTDSTKAESTVTDK